MILQDYSTMSSSFAGCVAGGGGGGAAMFSNTGNGHITTVLVYKKKKMFLVWLLSANLENTPHLDKNTVNVKACRRACGWSVGKRPPCLCWATRVPGSHALAK